MLRLVALLSFLLVVPNLLAAGKASHVLVVVWDGMRPDFVSEETTPNLFQLAREGATFKNHHPVYISSTEVNGTAIATGCYPGVSGVIANREFRPSIDSLNSVATEEENTIRKGDKLTEGHYLDVPTTAEILNQQHLRTALAGTKGVILLADRSQRPADAFGVNLFEGKFLPKEAGAKVFESLGNFPPIGTTKTNRDWWTANALMNSLWTNEMPAYSVLWLSEPDFSQHATAPGSPTALSVIKNSDAILGKVLATLKGRNLQDKTDVIVVSDHGFSTALENTDIVDKLKTNGFRAFRSFPEGGPQKGDILVVGGASVLLYVSGHDQALIEKLTHFLQTQPFCGVVFTKQPVAGAFPLKSVKLDRESAPDILLSLRWTAGKNEFGAPGRVWSDSGSYNARHGGLHGSLSPYDMHNICFAMGPDFDKGIVSTLPTGNVDIAPTALWILGIQPKKPMSGRVLSEALTVKGPKIKSYQPHHVEASYDTWSQYLNYTEVNGTIYFDEGNGAQSQ